MCRVNSILLFLICIGPPAFAGENNIIISDAWIGEAPPAASILAAYVTIKNNSAQPVSLVSASAPLFSRIEIHRSVLRNDIVSMERQNRLDIPAGETVVLSPGGYHLMLFDPAKPLGADDAADITLTFDNGHTESVTMAIKRHRDRQGYSPHHKH